MYWNWSLNAAAHTSDAPWFGPEVTDFEMSPPAARSNFNTTAWPNDDAITTGVAPPRQQMLLLLLQTTVLRLPTTTL
jgi:hypothetical protein